MILGAVLAGGGARRFGSDKALAVWQGRTLLDHAIAALESHADAVVVCGRDEAPRRCLADRPLPGLGPLGGLNAALDHAADHGFAKVITCGCDTPALSDDLLARLSAAPEPCYVAELPIIGSWPAILAPALDEWLARSPDRSLKGWARAASATSISAPGLANINTPADLDRLTQASLKETLNG